MRKYCLWVELEYEDGGRLRTNLEFDSIEDRNAYIESHSDLISDMEFSEKGEEE